MDCCQTGPLLCLRQEPYSRFCQIKFLEAAPLSTNVATRLKGRGYVWNLSDTTK